MGERFQFLEYELGTKGVVERKFWEPEVKGSSFAVNFGRSGTKGQSRQKEFSNEEEAANFKLKMVREKLLKGYIPTKETVNSLLENVSPVDNPQVVGRLMEGEHTEKQVETLVRWLTGCIFAKISPEDFEKAWDRRGDEDDFFDWLYPDDDGSQIEDFFGISDFYREALEKGADRFIFVDDNAFIDILALKGDPGAKAIMSDFFEERENDEEVAYIGLFPEVGPNSPISQLDLGAGWAVVTLRGNEQYEFDTIET